MNYFLLLLSFLVLPPELRVNWAAAGSRDSVTISVNGIDEVAAQCRRSGLELRYRYELRYCQEGRYWIDQCSDHRILVRALQWDPISQTFRVSTDTLGDADAPLVSTVDSEEVATHMLSSIPAVDLGQLFPNESESADRKREYLEVRLLTQCKGVSGATVERLSYFLSLGMVRTNGFNSGWISFRLGEPLP